MKNFKESNSKILKTILEIVSEKTKINIDILKKKTRKKEVVRARNIYFYCSRIYSDESLHQIGSIVNGKDHSTVVHATKKCEEVMQENVVYKQTVLSCMEEIEKTLKEMHDGIFKRENSKNFSVISFVNFLKDKYNIIIPELILKDWYKEK